MNLAKYFQLNIKLFPINFSDCYKSFVNYYKSIKGVLPHWYDVNYAYSGLHSIIYPPPNEVDIWGTVIIPSFQLNRNSAECEFCLDHYAEYSCQFYQPRSQLHVTKFRNGRLVLCECCDYTDVEDDYEDSTDQNGSPAVATTTSDTDELSSDAKRAKLDSIHEREPIKVQPGWYGKGYRKQMRRKKKRTCNLP